jgi:hypothetical protein
MRTVLRAAALLLLLAGLLAAAGPADGHLLVFKDGFVLEGRLHRQANYLYDRTTRDMVLIPKGNITLDDGPRTVVFSPAQVTVVENKPPPAEEQVQFRQVSYFNPKAPPPILEMVKVGAFDARGRRTVEVRVSGGVREVKQQLGVLTPSYLHVDSEHPRLQWISFYQTRELGPKAVRSVLASHPAFQETPALKPAERAQRRFRLCEFLVHAGWYDDAGRELDRLLADLPDQKERVEGARATLRHLQARDLFEEIKRLHGAGRHDAAARRIAEFPEAEGTEQMLAGLQEIKAEYEQARDRLKETARLLDAVRREASGGRGRELAEAAAAIAAELDADNAPRLDVFLSQARQAQRLRGAGKGPVLGAEEQLALVVSGWLLGPAAAESRPEGALRLWRARSAVLRYLRSDDEAVRRKALDELSRESRPDALLEEVAQMVPLLPPVEPVEATPGTVVAREVAGRRTKVRYRLLLPPEYRPTRSWPVLIVLHREGEKPEDMLKRWADAAATEGYVLAAPEWEQGVGGQYGYSEEEHAAVLETLRDLRRGVQVDSDRVFIFGLGEGGTMAFDVGLAHPDYFAGVLPMSGGPDLFARACWRNAQYLPFYVVTGNLGGDPAKQVREQFESWVQRGYPTLWLEYKGRGVEWFGAEVPTMFDWMRPKRRAFPMQQLGSDGNGGPFGNELCTLRGGDNHFYWLAADEVRAGWVNNATSWRRGVTPATLTGRIDPQANEVFLTASGVGRVTLWLGRTSGGRTMVDFDRPLTVRANLQPVWINRKAAPSLAVLLEDLRDRGDRQQLFLAKITVRLR